MGRSMIVALHEFKVNFRRKEYLFFSFVVPVLLIVGAAFLFSIGMRVTLIEFKQMQQGNWAFVFPSIIAMVFSLAIFLSANFLLQRIATEKESRILEILVSSVSFRELLVGKIFGMALLGLIQFFSWMATGFIVMSLAAPVVLEVLIYSHFGFEAVILYLIFFLLGYFLYAALLAAVGILSETRSQAQQVSWLLSFFALVPAISTLFLSKSGPNTLATILTLFPLTTPIAAMIRIFIGNMPLAEIVAGIVVLLITIAVLIFITARLFRAEVLMYGKSFSFKELVRFALNLR